MRVHAIGREEPGFALYQNEPAQMPSGAQGKNGLLRLGFDKRGSRTVLASLERRTPLLAQKALYWDEAMPDMACVFVIMTSGCILGGDRLTLEIDLGANARAHVTTQAATKIHTMNANFAAQVQNIRLGPNAYLEYLPDAVIPHRGSRFLTETRIAMDSSATLIYSEILLPGRKYHLEEDLFGWEVFSSKVTVVNPDETTLFTEKFVIQPRRRDVRHTGVMGSYDVFGNVLLLTPKIHADRILDRTEPKITPDVACGATRLPNDAGLVFKVLGKESNDVKKKIHEFWSSTREVIAGCEAPNGWFWK